MNTPGFHFELSDNQTFEIIDLGGTRDGTFTDLSDGDSVGTFGNRDLFISYAGGDGNDITLSTVPEPGTLMLLGLGGAWMIGPWRRRRHGSQA